MTEKPKKKRGGQPVTYNADTAKEICRRMANGETLRSICREKGMPPESTVREWAADNRDGFAAVYARARDLLIEYWADEVIAVADDSSEDFVEKEGKNGTAFKAVNEEAINRSRLRVDTRKWLMSRLKPSTYGDRVATELSGPGGGPVVLSAGGLPEKLDLARWIANKLAVGAIAAETLPMLPKPADDEDGSS